MKDSQCSKWFRMSKSEEKLEVMKILEFKSENESIVDVPWVFQPLNTDSWSRSSTCRKSTLHQAACGRRSGVSLTQV